MPPLLRSSRAASRAGSQAVSRPQTPRDAPSTLQSTSLSEPARPQKQLKTGRKTKTPTAVAVDSGQNRKRKTPNASTDQAANEQTTQTESGAEEHGMTDSPTEYVGEPWVEPPVMFDRPSFKKPVDRVQLEDRPLPGFVRRAERAPRATRDFTKRVGKKTTNKEKSTPTPASELPEQSDTPRPNEQGDQTAPVTTRSTSAAVDDVPAEANNTNNDGNIIPNDVAPVNDSNNIEKDAAAVNDINNIEKDNNNIEKDGAPANDNNSIQKDAAAVTNNNISTSNDAAPVNEDDVPYNAVPVNGQEPADDLALPDQPQENSTVEKVREIIDAAISRAEGYEDPRVADGLRQIQADSDSDPFLLSVVGSALTKQDGSIERAAFEKVLREAVRRAKATADTQNVQSAPIAQPGPSATDMARTQSGISSSSLSTAKSVAAPAIVADVEEAAAVTAPPTTAPRPIVQARRGRGKKRVSRTTKAKAKAKTKETPTTNRGRKRKPEHPPELTNEAIAVKKRALEKTIVSGDVEAKVVNAREEGRSPRPNSLPPVTRSWTPETQFTEGPEVDPETDPRNHYKPRARAEEIDNNDYCDVCDGSGQLLCCDSCVKSFHFGCLDPKLDPKNPPEGEWFCSSCSKEGVFGALSRLIDVQKPVSYRLPKEIRTFYKDVHTGPGGRYEEGPDFVLNERERPSKGEDGVEFRLRLVDGDDKLIQCHGCRQTSQGRRQLLQCDFCPDYWHMDCVDPPLTFHPVVTAEKYAEAAARSTPQEPGKHPFPFKCPNHSADGAIDGSMPHSLGRFRRPRHPKYKDVDVIPDDEPIRDWTEEYTVWEDGEEVVRVREKGVMVDFINRVRTGRVERKERSKAYLERSKALAGAAALASLDPTEQHAVVGLVQLGNAQPTTNDPDRHGHLVSQLVASAPESARQSTDELGMLRAVQALINQRVDDLVSGGQSTN